MSFSQLRRNTKKASKPKESAGTTMSKAARSDRNPYFSIDSSMSASEVLCRELGEAIRKNPSLSMANFLRITSASMSELQKSDAVIITLAAILNELDMTSAATNLLNKSGTNTRVFHEMGLNKKEVSRMYVTLLFTLNPELGKMIEGALKTALSRMSNVTTAPGGEARMESAIGMMVERNSISKQEADTHFGIRANAEMVEKPNKRMLFMRASVNDSDTVVPDDSASVVGTQIRRTINTSEKDLIERMKRVKAKTGLRRSFEEEFPNAAKPVSVLFRAPDDKSGLGFNKGEHFEQSTALLSGPAPGTWDDMAKAPVSPSETKTEQVLNALLRANGDKSFRLQKVEEDEAVMTFEDTASEIPDRSSVFTTMKRPLGKRDSIADLLNDLDSLVMSESANDEYDDEDFMTLLQSV